MAYNTSLFAQLLHTVPRPAFDRLVRATRADRYCKSFTSWDQCVAMLYLHFVQAKSLREVSDGLRSCGGKLSHLGIRAPTHSTLAHANAPRPAALYEQLFQQLLARCRAQRHGPRKFKFKNPLYSLDSTTSTLCLGLFPWAKFRQREWLDDPFHVPPEPPPPTQLTLGCWTAAAPAPATRPTGARPKATTFHVKQGHADERENLIGQQCTGP